ncbi:hypothetical protein PAXINDRAFT_171392 [Paxillus involutus ATCC 200175]|uniref:Uncharacterized protein n=1 Tax=Paxillus involutus ATCC 200175 TaxID=664439 RepID=A0A0C9STI5_PAXIN|nr:hypothetical protein PAXINDRAFT_171392 [Paxillus involutus ATCC 200175]
MHDPASSRHESVNPSPIGLQGPLLIHERDTIHVRELLPVCSPTFSFRVLELR